MATITTTTKLALSVAAVGWLIGALIDKRTGAIIFGTSFIVATLSICLPILRHKASNWGERGFKLFAFGFMTGAVPSAASMIAGRANWADFFMSIGIAICMLAMAITLFNWRSFT